VARRYPPLLVLAAVGTLFAAFFILVAPMAKAAGTIFVSPSGSDSAAGTSASSAKKTLQGALDAASSGTTIQLAAGRYAGNLKTKTAGVTITGPAGAVVTGSGNDRTLEVNHDDTTLKGFTIDGGGRLIFVIGTKAGDGVTGTRIEGMTLKNAQGECIRLKYLATNSVINGNKIGPCGLEDFQGGGGGKNGEGVYIGTAPE
jgi:nitrous oxidase accessory protein NosD